MVEAMHAMLAEHARAAADRSKRQSLAWSERIQYLRAADRATSDTNGLKRPFDPTITEGMIETATALVEETGACMAYTQSDEISLAWHQTDIKSQIWFDGRISKMTSQLGALATLHFYRFVLKRMSFYAFKLPTFDARVWQVPNRTEAANVFLWREWDATKNSLSMAGGGLALFLAFLAHSPEITQLKRAV